MLSKRFMRYIKGGSCGNRRYHPPCEDTSLPVLVKTVEIPYDMYFGNTSGSWNDCGVSFLDTTRKGKAYGVAYLITKTQFEHIIAEENGGRPPMEGFGWYEDIIDLGTMDGFEVKTITNNTLRHYNDPCFEYWETLLYGMHEHWPEMSIDEISDYLNSCIR